jgi:hypothetical protein
MNKYLKRMLIRIPLKKMFNTLSTISCVHFQNKGDWARSEIHSASGERWNYLDKKKYILDNKPSNDTVYDRTSIWQ